LTTLRGLGIAVTGADGFVGSALCPGLDQAGARVRRVVRAPKSDIVSGPAVAVGDIGPVTDWGSALTDVSCVVHLAARTHVLRETASDALNEYRRINVGGTKRLAEQAAAAGVRRLVFLSSIKVNGEATAGDAYDEEDAPRPEDAYGVSKWEAERCLHAGASVPPEVVILRPPLVYGPGVKGNFLRLLGLVERGAPLPLGSIRNRRSLLYVGNLVDAIIAAITRPAAAGRTYLVSDGQDLSTPELVRAIARLLGTRARLLPFPVSLLRLGGSMLGRADEIARLTGSLRIDSSRIRREFDWAPRWTVEAGLAETVRWYHARERAVRGSP
jgi:UDP-N-acetyl-alpha-D-quinovosamine dehydrogenase